MKDGSSRLPIEENSEHGSMRCLWPCLLLLIFPACQPRQPGGERPTTLIPLAGEWTQGEEHLPLEPPLADPTLDAWFEMSLKKNPSFLQKVEAVEILRQQEAIAKANRLPLLSWGLDASRRQSHQGIPGSDFRSSSHGVDLALSWEADLWGRLDHLRSAARSDRLISEIDREAMKISLRRQLSLRWVALVEVREGVVLIEKQLKTLEQLKGIYRLDLELDTSSSDRFLRARRRYQDPRIRKEDLLSLGKEEHIMIRELLGGQETLEQDFEKKLLPDLGGVGDSSMVRILSRPDVLGAAQRLRAQLSRQKAADLSWWPQFKLSLSGGSSSLQIKNLLDPEKLVWVLASSITQQLFQGDRKKAEKSLEESRVKAALQACVEVVQSALSEVELSLEKESGHSKALKLLSSQETDLRGIEKQWQDRFQSGDGGVAQVIEARLDRYSLEERQLRRRADRLRNRLDLFFSLGGGFEGVEGIQPPRLEEGE